jgi:nucleotide-binding universal stress UspA family protein
VKPTRTIAVAVDGSEPAAKAFEKAVELARASSESLTVVGVVPVHREYAGIPSSRLEADPAQRRWFTDLLHRYVEEARRKGVADVSSELFEGSPIECLVTFVDVKKPDLLVLGARGVSTTRRLLLGSVSEGVLHHSHGSVLIVRDYPRVRSGNRPARNSVPAAR